MTDGQQLARPAAALRRLRTPAPGQAVAGDSPPLLARAIDGVDLDAARRAAADFLLALGIDVNREDMQETPGRMARAYAEQFQARPLRLTTFPNDEGYDELVLAREIPFRAVCEHHLLPFSAWRTSATCRAALSGTPAAPSVTGDQ